MLELRIVEFEDEYMEKWDKFVLNQSVNGTFLQTRNFLNYHGDRFTDASLMIIKGNDTIVAVIPACLINENEKKIFHAHRGSTFGGIVIADSFYNIEHVDAIMNVLDDYFSENKYDEVWLSFSDNIFSKRKMDMFSYFLFQKEYRAFEELNCYIDFSAYNEDVLSNFTSGRRRDYKYSLRNDLEFRKIDADDDIAQFYDILCENLEKFGAKPVHSLEELIDFKNVRLVNNTEFYAVYHENKMIAGSMVFLFDDNVFHTQYLAASQDSLKLYPMNYLDTNLIITAKQKGFRYFSFGTSTEEHGKVLNKKLAEFKEGFGTNCGVNKTYVKSFNK